MRTVATALLVTFALVATTPSDAGLFGNRATRRSTPRRTPQRTAQPRQGQPRAAQPQATQPRTAQPTSPQRVGRAAQTRPGATAPQPFAIDFDKALSDAPAALGDVPDLDADQLQQYALAIESIVMGRDGWTIDQMPPTGSIEIRLQPYFPEYPRSLDPAYREIVQAKPDSTREAVRSRRELIDRATVVAYEARPVQIAPDRKSARLIFCLVNSSTPEDYDEFLVMSTTRGPLIVDSRYSKTQLWDSAVTAMQISQRFASEGLAELLPPSMDPMLAAHEEHAKVLLDFLAIRRTSNDLRANSVASERVIERIEQTVTMIDPLPERPEHRRLLLNELVDLVAYASVSEDDFLAKLRNFERRHDFRSIRTDCLFLHYGDPEVDDDRMLAAVEAMEAFGEPRAIAMYYKRLVEKENESDSVDDSSEDDTAVDLASLATHLPLTEARLLELAVQLEAATLHTVSDESDPIDVMAFYDRIGDEVGEVPSGIVNIASKLMIEQRFQLHDHVDRVGDTILEGGSYEYLSSKVDEGGRSGKIVFVESSRGAFPSYDEWIVAPNADGVYQVVDLIHFGRGISLSESMAITVAEDLKKHRLAGPQLSPRLQSLAAAGETVGRAFLLNQADRYDEAVAVFDDVPARFRDLAFVVNLRARVAINAGLMDDREAVREIRKTIPDSTYADLLLYRAVPDAEGDAELVAATERLIERFGPAVWLLDSLAISNMASGGELATSVAVIERAIERKPTSSRLYRTMISLQGEYGTPDDTLAWLIRADEAIVLSWDTVQDWPELEGFLETEQYEDWLKHLGGGPSYDQRKRMAGRPKVAL